MLPVCTRNVPCNITWTWLVLINNYQSSLSWPNNRFYYSTQKKNNSNSTFENNFITLWNRFKSLSMYTCEHKWKTIIFYKAALSHLKRTNSTSMYSKTMSLLIFVLFLKSSYNPIIQDIHMNLKQKILPLMTNLWYPNKSK